jgi:alpha-L-fucosidase
VGRNSLLLLNIPPNKDGLLEEGDIRAIDSFRTILNETFAKNLAERKTKNSLTDKSLSTFISIEENKPLIIDFGKKQAFDRLLMQENIKNGQNVKQGLWEYWDGNDWQLIQSFSTVGYKRLLRFNTIESSKLRLTITGTKSYINAELSEIGIYKASAGE